METIIGPGAVVVGVDGTTGSEIAVHWAASHAQDTDSALVIAHATGASPATGELLNGEEGRRRARAAAHKLTAHAMTLAEQASPGVEVDTLVQVADARQLLVDLSAQASILVVGTRGRGPVKSLVLGSVSVAVAARARCPVAVVREVEPEEEGPRAVIAGVDDSPTMDEVLALAYDLAECQGRPLEVVHCWQMGGHVSGKGTYSAWLRELNDREQMLDDAMALQAEKHPDVRASRHLMEDEPLPALLDRSEAAAVLVVGSRGRSWARAVIGSVSRAVLERARCTVVVARS